LIANNGITVEKAHNYVNENKVDMVSFAKLYVTNPDLAIRIKNGNPLN
jgi:2,4-dienoyl-CoA reductase-like NADH-dependent reductase (Old Yellow Enzyme family)